MAALARIRGHNSKSIFQLTLDVFRFPEHFKSNALKVEARVGIGQLDPKLERKIAVLRGVINTTLSLLFRAFAHTLTHVFAHTPDYLLMHKKSSELDGVL